MPLVCTTLITIKLIRSATFIVVIKQSDVSNLNNSPLRRLVLHDSGLCARVGVGVRIDSWLLMGINSNTLYVISTLWHPIALYCICVQT